MKTLLWYLIYEDSNKNKFVTPVAEVEQKVKHLNLNEMEIIYNIRRKSPRNLDSTVGKFAHMQLTTTTAFKARNNTTTLKRKVIDPDNDSEKNSNVKKNSKVDNKNNNNFNNNNNRENDPDNDSEKKKKLNIEDINTRNNNNMDDGAESLLHSTNNNNNINIAESEKQNATLNKKNDMVVNDEQILESEKENSTLNKKNEMVVNDEEISESEKENSTLNKKNEMVVNDEQISESEKENAALNKKNEMVVNDEQISESEKENSTLNKKNEMVVNDEEISESEKENSTLNKKNEMVVNDEQISESEKENAALNKKNDIVINDEQKEIATMNEKNYIVLSGDMDEKRIFAESSNKNLKKKSITFSSTTSIINKNDNDTKVDPLEDFQEHIRRIETSLFEISEDKEMALFFTFESSEMKRKVATIIVDRNLSLQDKVEQLKNLPILHVGKKIDALYPRTTKGDGSCGPRILNQLRTKDFVEDIPIAKYAIEIKKFDFDLTKNADRDKFIAFLKEIIQLLATKYTSEDIINYFISRDVIEKFSGLLRLLEADKKFNFNTKFNPNHWLFVNEMAFLIPELGLESNLFVTSKGVPTLRDIFALDKHEKFSNVEWSFLEYTNVGMQDKNLMEMGLTYLEMQAVLKCNQNIYTDMYEKQSAGHYNTAGNFKVVDALTNLDILFTSIFHNLTSLYEGANIFCDYSYEDILNCFKDSINTDELINPILELTSDIKLKKEILQMHRTKNEFDLFKQNLRKYKDQTRLRQEQRYQDSEEDNNRLRKENAALKKVLMENEKKMLNK
jgi:hypothetical protein